MAESGLSYGQLVALHTFLRELCTTNSAYARVREHMLPSRLDVFTGAPKVLYATEIVEVGSAPLGCAIVCLTDGAEPYFGIARTAVGGNKTLISQPESYSTSSDHAIQTFKNTLQTICQGKAAGLPVAQFFSPLPSVNPWGDNKSKEQKSEYKKSLFGFSQEEIAGLHAFVEAIPTKEDFKVSTTVGGMRCGNFIKFAAYFVSSAAPSSRSIFRIEEAPSRNGNPARLLMTTTKYDNDKLVYDSVLEMCDNKSEATAQFKEKLRIAFGGHTTSQKIERDALFLHMSKVANNRPAASPTYTIPPDYKLRYQNMLFSGSPRAKPLPLAAFVSAMAVEYKRLIDKEATQVKEYPMREPEKRPAYSEFTKGAGSWEPPYDD